MALPLHRTLGMNVGTAARIGTGALLLLMGCAQGASDRAAVGEGVSAPDAGALDGAREPAVEKDLPPCVEVVETGQPGMRPVDAILVVDNSSSMGEEIAAVVENISTSFTAILASSGIDYRIILLSYHGDPDDNPEGPADRPICIRAPLSGTDCAPPPPRAAATDRFFQYQVAIDSTDSLERILDTFDRPDANGDAPGGWGAWLREGSLAVFLEITDDASDLTADEFEARLLALEPGRFGTREAREYVFHSIVGIAPKDALGSPWLPTDAIQGSECDTASGPGVAYEELSTRTGGLRFPVCETDGYDVVFEAISEGVVETVLLSCTFDLRAPGEELVVDLSGASVRYTTSSGEVHELARVPAAADCAADSYYVVGTSVHLCPQACESVRSDATASVEVEASCAAMLI